MKKSKAKAAMSSATWLERVNQRLKGGVQLRADGLWIVVEGKQIHLRVPEDVRQMVLTSKAGKGVTPATLAKRLTCYALNEWERRFSNCFPEDEPDAATLTKLTDHTWKVA